MDKKEERSTEPEYYNINEFTTVITVKDEQLTRDLMRMTKKQIREAYQCVCIIGATGAGKSSTCNTIIRDSEKNSFAESSGISSETFKTKGILAHWFGDDARNKIILLDTPGLGDSQGRDTQHIAEMIVALQTVGYVHTFLLCFNSQSPRFDEHLKAMIKIFMQMFGAGFFSNIVVCFTRFSFNEDDVDDRGGPDVLEKKIREEYIAAFNKEYAVTLKENQFIFIDNGCNTSNPKVFERRGGASVLKQLDNLVRFTGIVPPFFCHDIKAVLSKYDSLAGELKKERERIEREKELHSQQISSMEDEAAREREAHRQALLREQEQRAAAVRAKEEELLRLRQEWERNQAETARKLEQNQRSIEKEQKKYKKLEEDLEKRKQEESIRQIELAEKLEQKREEMNSKFEEQLRRAAEDKEKQVLAYVTLIGELKLSHQTEIGNKDTKIVQLETLHEKALTAKDESHKKVVAEKDESIKTLNGSLAKIKKTCIFCKSEHPTGVCSSRYHIPILYPRDHPNYSGYKTLVIDGHGRCRICSRNADQGDCGNDRANEGYYESTRDILRQFHANCSCDHLVFGSS